MVKETENMFAIRILQYYKAMYYTVSFNDHVAYIPYLEKDLFYQVQKLRGFFKTLHKDKKVDKWLARFSRKTHENTYHKSRNF